MSAVVPGHPWYPIRERLDALKAGDLREAPKTYDEWLRVVSAVIHLQFCDAIYYGTVLQYVPEEFKTAELCLAAVKNEGSALEFVPEALKSEEICHAAIYYGHQAGMGMGRIVYGSALKYVPQNLRTHEICLTALLNDGSFDDVPDSIKTREFYLAVLTERHYGYVSKDKVLVNAVPDTVKSAEFYLEVVQRQKRAFEYVPDEYKTIEMCRFAVEHDVYSGGWVSANAYYECVTPELAYVPQALKTVELCKAAVAQNWHALEYVPEELKTGEICRVAVEACESARKYVPASILPLIKALQEKVDEERRIAVAVSVQDGGYIVLTDEKTGRTKKIHQSLITDNKLTIENGTVKISPSLYNSWFMEKK
jgi:hypothetical protein